MSIGSTARYVVQRSNSRLAFRIRLIAWKTEGEFAGFEGTIDYDPARPDAMTADVTIQVDSIDTRVPARDKHLRSADFFDSEKFPTIRFVGNRATSLGNGKLKLDGELTMRDVTRPLALEVAAIEATHEETGRRSLRFIASGKLNRMDWGVGGRSLLDRGQIMVGHEVDLDVRLESSG